MLSNPEVRREYERLYRELEMKVLVEALERLIARQRGRGAGEVAGWYEALLADTPGARDVRDWLKKHARPGIGRTCRELFYPNAEDWEAEIHLIVMFHFQQFIPVSKRELIPQDKLGEKTLAIANKARALASDLEQLEPWGPSVLAFFDDERAVDIIRALPPKRAMLLLFNTGYSKDRGDGYQRTREVIPGLKMWSGPAESLAGEFGDRAWHHDNLPTPQLFPSLLRRLAEYIEKNAAQPSRLSRKKKPKGTPSQDADWADSRVFARELAGLFMKSYGERPWTVLATLVSIRFPDMGDPPDARTIEDLCRNRSKK